MFPRTLIGPKIEVVDTTCSGILSEKEMEKQSEVKTAQSLGSNRVVEMQQLTLASSLLAVEP